MATPTSLTSLIEQYSPYVRYNGGISTNLPVYINNDITITGSASFAGSTFTDLTATGNTVLGNASTDTLAVTGISTFTLSSASTSGSTSVENTLFSTTMTGVGGVGGRVRAYMTTNVALGSWSNAFKGEVTYGASGRTSGLGSAVLAEMTLSAGTSSGTYAPLELELNLGTGALTGTATSLMYASVNGADAATFSTNGFIMTLAGLTAGASNVFATGLTGATVVGNMTAAIRIKVGSTTYFIPLATALT